MNVTEEQMRQSAVKIVRTDTHWSVSCEYSQLRAMFDPFRFMTIRDAIDQVKACLSSCVEFNDIGQVSFVFELVEQDIYADGEVGFERLAVGHDLKPITFNYLEPKWHPNLDDTTIQFILAVEKHMEIALACEGEE